MKVHRDCLVGLGSAAIAATVVFALGAAGERPAVSLQTPVELVATYESLADSILSTKKTEEYLVRSILATTYAHAQGVAAQVSQVLRAGRADEAKKLLQDLADLVGQLGTEGDNAVGRVRKRLLEGGHHHNAAGEAQGLYEEGYVVVTRAAKKTLLEASQALAQLSRNPSAEGLEAGWKKVSTTYDELMKPKK